MANAQNIALKAAQVEGVAEKLQKAASVVVFDYRGLTVAEVTALRAEMRKAGIEYVVIKNHIVRRACEAAKLDKALLDTLKGPSAFAISYDDAIAPAKILKAAIKKYKKCEMKGGVVEGAFLTAAQMDQLADVPSREVLIARLLGSLCSPITKLAILLDQIAKKQQPEAAAE